MMHVTEQDSVWLSLLNCIYCYDYHHRLISMFAFLNRDDSLTPVEE